MTPIPNVPIDTTQNILFASLCITLLAVFIAMAVKQLILYSISSEVGWRRRIKLAALRGRGLRLVMFLQFLMLVIALVLFFMALINYFWDLGTSVPRVIMWIGFFGFFLSVVAIVSVAVPPYSLMFFTDPFPPPLSAKKPTGLSNVGFWRQDPLFTSPAPKDTAAFAGFWLLENSTGFSAASAVAAIFPEIQWPSHYHSMAALYQFRDTYVECFRAPELNKTTRLRALQSAAAYYVLYHTQLIWSISTNSGAGVESISSLSPDLFLQHSEEWGGDDVFEYLLRIEDRSTPVTSARFLSYIAPYWFCGDSDFAVRFRPSRLQILNELIEVLKSNRALNPATATDCILCAGAVMDFPLHPEDLIRVDKRYVLFSP